MIGDIRLRTLPLSVRVILTAFVAIIGCGYLAALGNLYYRFEQADDRPGLSLNDIRATFQGLATTPRGDAGTADASSQYRSRMLTMIEPGGEMRKHLVKGGEPSVRALTTWLTRGALESEFERAGLAQPDDPAARAVIERQCLRCHNAQDGERKKSPFAKDGFDADFAMVRVYSTPGTDSLDPNANPAGGHTAGRQPASIAPQPISHLLLIAHIHMLSIPMFTLVVALLFLCTPARRDSSALRGLIAAAPMVMLCSDFACWWLARWIGPAIYVIPVAGALYGITLAVQLLRVFGAMWLGRRETATEI